MIHQENIEIYILDFYEGRLRDHEIEALMKFLVLHPEWKKVFDEFEMITLEEDSSAVLSDDFRNHLKKQAHQPHDISEKRIQELLIGELEQTLSQQDQELLLLLLSGDRNIQSQRELYKKTILVPDYSMVYPNKQLLKKGRHPIYKIPAFKYSAVAATFLLLLISYNIFKEPTIPALNVAMEHRNMISGSEISSSGNTPIKASQETEPFRYAPTNQSLAPVLPPNQSGDDQREALPSDYLYSSLKGSTLVEGIKPSINLPETNGKIYIRREHPMSAAEKSQLRKYLVPQKKAISPGTSDLRMEPQNLPKPELEPQNPMTTFNQPPLLIQLKSKGFGQQVIAKINADAGLDIIEEDSRKFNFRNALIAISRFVQDRRGILRHTERESSEEIAIRLGNLEIGQAFSK